jgi:hypothetical protein
MGQKYVTFEEIDELLDKVFHGKEHHIVYSASEYIDDGSEFGRVENNLDEIAVEGKCIFKRERSDFWGGETSKDYSSKILSNPTWKEVCVLADESIKKVNDYHHVFLEGVRFMGTNSYGIGVYEFWMGS